MPASAAIVVIAVEISLAPVGDIAVAISKAHIANDKTIAIGTTWYSVSDRRADVPAAAAVVHVYV